MPVLHGYADLCAGGAADPQATRTARVLAAYFAAARARAFRRSVWRQATIVALLGWSVEATTTLITPQGLLRGVAALVIIAAAAGMADLLAARRLTTTLTDM